MDIEPPLADILEQGNPKPYGWSTELDPQDPTKLTQDEITQMKNWDGSYQPKKQKYPPEV